MYLRDLPKRKKYEILAGVLLAMLLGALDSTIVGPAMPKIVQDLGGMSLLSWVFTIYSLASTIAVPIVGKLSDLYGRKWFYIWGIALFLAGSALSGAAGESWMTSFMHLFGLGDSPMLQLIIFRGIQGLGGGMMMSNAMAIIGDLFTARERGRFQGLTGAIFGFASVFGPMLGGWLTDSVSWRWIFYINIPIGLLALGVLLVVMPKPERGQNHAIDWWGSTALIVGLVPLLLALNWGGSEYEWGSVTIIGLFAFAALALLVFGLIERRTAEPILDLALFRDRSFTASMIVLFLSGVGMFGSIMFLPVFRQIVQGASASSSGALLMPMMLSMVAGSVVTGQLISRTGKYRNLGLIGLVVATVGMGMLARLTVSTPDWWVVASMILLGVGVGVTMPLFTIALQSQFPSRIGEVTAGTQFFRSIGGTVGVALLGGVMNARFADELGTLVTRDAAKFGPLAGKLKELTADPSALLNTGAMDVIGKAVPEQLKPVLTTFFADVQVALSSSISTTFLYGAVLLALAFVAMFFVREVSLDVRPSTSVETAAVELFEGEAVQPAEAEVALLGGDAERDEVAGPSA